MLMTKNTRNPAGESQKRSLGLSFDGSLRLEFHGSKISCHDFVDNEVRLHLFVLAYNLGNFLRQAVLPPAVRHWTTTTLREKLIKIGAKVVRHARKVVFQMAEVAVPRELFRDILRAIERLRPARAASG